MNKTKQEENKKLEIFSKAPVPKAVLVNAVPAMVVQIMVLIYSMADTFFVGQVNDAYQLAAVSIAMPVFLVFMAVGSLFGVGGTSAISRSMGEGNYERTKRICSFCMWAGLIAGLLLTAVMLIGMDGILGLIGTTANTEDYTRKYLTIVSLCGPFVVISNCFSNIIRAEGQSAKAMIGQTAGNLINFVLDPIMILALNWQITGAAIATVIGNAFAAFYYLAYFARGKSKLSISPKYFKTGDGVASSVLAIGIPAAIGFILMSLATIVLNARMSGYNDMAVAGVGVACKIAYMTSALAMGLGQGVQPLFGYCVGAKMWDRYRKCFRFAFFFSLLLSGGLAVICLIATKPIVCLFLADADAIIYGVRFSRILLSTSALVGVLYVLIYAMQAMGAAKASFFVNLSRQGIIYIPLLFILQSMWGINGLVWAQPVADLVMLIVSGILLTKLVKEKAKETV